MKIREWLNKLRGKKRGPILIQTEYGIVTESARHQAAINMKLNPEKKAEVEALLIARAGGNVERGLRRAREHYPEAYE